MPSFGQRFSAAAREAVGIAQAGELARSEAEPGSVTYAEFSPARLEALYEMAYLRIFIAWEDLLEETFLRFLCGYELDAYVPRFAPPHQRQSSLPDARAALYGGQDYILWHNPAKALQRCRRWFVGGIHSQVLGSRLSDLEALAVVRHRIAHGSAQVKQNMDTASMHLAGRRYPGSSAGRFLRDWKTDDPLVRERQLRVTSNMLVGLAQQLAP